MKNKIMLFDAKGDQVGETFMRRARQLVNQQRAEWINDGAIRFKQDVDLDELEWKTDVQEEAKDKGIGTESLLYYLAEKRINERKAFIWHTIFLIPGYLLCILLGMHNDHFLVFLLGLWSSPYAIHVFIFARTLLREYSPEDRERKLEREVDKLRRMMG
ncbi:MAG: hypothetical protein FWD03_01740 [Defluviitaleaceae bacterium]|nr:hypothetical protein [Defluviitaleaceae bacterium]